MIRVDELFKAVVDQANSEESGLIDPVFNSFLKLAELALLDWLTGNLANPNEAPAPFLTEKNKAWLLPFIQSKPGNFKTTIPIPDDYYIHQSLRVRWQKDCDSEKALFNDVNIVHSNKVETIKSSVIRGIQPTSKKPIGEVIGRTIQLHPQPEGGEYDFIYVREPKFGKYITKEDTTFMDQVYDPAKSENLEWPIATLPYFVFKINDYINTRHRELDAFQMNQVNNPQNQKR